MLLLVWVPESDVHMGERDGEEGMEQQARVLQLVVEEKEGGSRLDRYLTEKVEGRSRSYLRKLIDQGLVLVNGRQVKAGYSITAGDKVRVEIPPPQPIEVVPESIPLDILYEDQDIIVINKPPGMVVHPAAGNYQGTLVNALLAHCRDLSGIGGSFGPALFTGWIRTPPGCWWL